MTATDEGQRSPAPSSERVELKVPASPRYLRLARLTAAGMAGDLGFDMQSLEDLRVAVDELCAAVIEDVDGAAVLELSYRQTARGIRIDGEVAARGPAVDLHPVAEELLRMVADQYELTSTDDRRTFWVIKEPGAADSDRP